MNHKRGKPKNARAGCLMCKPWKVNGAASKPWNVRGQDKRNEVKARADLNEVK